MDGIILMIDTAGKLQYILDKVVKKKRLTIKDKKTEFMVVSERDSTASCK